MNKTKRYTLKTTIIYSLTVFLIMGITLIITASVTILLFHTGRLTARNPIIFLIIFTIVSIAIGTVFSTIVGRRFLAPVIEISEATKKVARGDFSVVLSEDTRGEETRTMAHNFNIMTQELAHTEMFHNDFIENVSHEFKTPLSAIEGYVTLLQKKNLSEEKRAVYTARILFNTKRLSALTGNILLLSRLENQEIEVAKELFSLDEQLREMILLLEHQWGEKNIALEIDLDTVDYYGNRELLEQVWQNIVGNAVKFAPQNGNIRILLRTHLSQIKVSVTDNGSGMTPEVMAHIYEKFYQGDSSRSSLGNGLGLTLARRIVDLHNGSMKASSEEGRGTTITVILPMK
jgi:signal transduction histidine kinase